MMNLRFLTLFLFVLTLTACSQKSKPVAVATTDGPELAKPVPELADQFNHVFRAGDVYFAGLPTKQGIRELAGDGVKLVVNLLTDAEQSKRVSFDEPAFLESLNIDYLQLPVKPKTLSKQDVDRLAEKMAETKGKVLIHCASSNRVGALWASYLALHEGMPVEQALAHGKAAGLRASSLEEAVKRIAAK